MVEVLHCIDHLGNLGELFFIDIGVRLVQEHLEKAILFDGLIGEAVVDEPAESDLPLPHVLSRVLLHLLALADPRHQHIRVLHLQVIVQVVEILVLASYFRSHLSLDHHRKA